MTDEEINSTDINTSEQAQQLVEEGDRQYLAGDYAAAINSYSQALSIYQTIGDQENETLTLYRLGETYYTLADYRRPANWDLPSPSPGNDPDPSPDPEIAPSPISGFRSPYLLRSRVQSEIFGETRLPTSTGNDPDPGSDPTPNPRPSPFPTPSPGS